MIPRGVLHVDTDDFTLQLSQRRGDFLHEKENMYRDFGFHFFRSFKWYLLLGTRYFVKRNWRSKLWKSSIPAADWRRRCLFFEKEQEKLECVRPKTGMMR